jgi:hypothetical protein
MFHGATKILATIGLQGPMILYNVNDLDLVQYTFHIVMEYWL